jgi:gluconolactonase
MLTTLLAVAFVMQDAPAAPTTATPPTPAAEKPVLAPKWPRQDGTAGEDIPGIVAKGTPILKWSEGHNFTEGPACAADGTVYFVDIPGSEIFRIEPAGAASLTRKSNSTFGLFVAKDGTLYAAQGNPGAITRVDPATGAITTVCEARAEASGETGTALGRLNDLVVDDDGGIWFTAPVLGRRKANSPPDAVYFVKPAAAGESLATAVEVARDEKVRGPNGIALSPDGKTLYVVPYLSLEIMAYPVEAPGKLGAGRVLYKIPSGTRETLGGDGLTVDAKGNLFVAIPARSAIFVLSPEGKALGMIRFPERTSNCKLGGKDGRTLFVTASTGVYSIEVETARSR